VSKIVWPDEATLKLNNLHNYVYWAPEDPHILMKKAKDLTGQTVCLQRFKWDFIFEGTVTALKYINILWTFILPTNNRLYGSEPF
jgi:hypothetical protein